MITYHHPGVLGRGHGNVHEEVAVWLRLAGYLMLALFALLALAALVFLAAQPNPALPPQLASAGAVAGIVPG
jgi:hypothetical protein